ncbi:hypothetical protein HK405_008230 [Cladochytrium tenue]|nr:hypothetical protein HK405_008230 [Cladochytrium tenue]
MAATIVDARGPSADTGEDALLSCCLSGSVWDEGEPTGRLEKIGGVDCYVAASSNPESTDYIMILTDVFGIKLINTRLVADRFASKGYQVVVPDILAGDEADPDEMEELMEPTKGLIHGVVKTVKTLAFLPRYLTWRRRHGDDTTLPVISAVAAELRAAPTAAGPAARRIAAVGYCFGGRPAVILSVAGDPAFDAFAVAHPSGLKLPEDLDAVALPGLFCLAEDDMALPPPKAAQVKAAFADAGRRAGKPAVEVKDYAGTRHGYAVRAKLSDEVARKARDQTLEDMVAFFNKVFSK